jgi:hypothetical protein
MMLQWKTHPSYGLAHAYAAGLLLERGLAPDATRLA